VVNGPGGITRLKRAHSGGGGSVAKGNRVMHRGWTKAAPKTVDEYLAGVPEPARSTLNKVRAAIRYAVPPEATESISYGVPMFKHKGLLLGFAAFPSHCGLFVTSPSLMEAFKNELKGFDTSKGTIRFPVDKPLPAALVKKLVKARIAQNEEKKRR
jgi:uncharacterized protein YdhG (YjbR/CyaY superfamily)